MSLMAHTLISVHGHLKSVDRALGTRLAKHEDASCVLSFDGWLILWYARGVVLRGGVVKQICSFTTQKLRIME